MNRIITILAIGICLAIALLSLRQVSNAAPDSSPQIDVSGVANGGFELSSNLATNPIGWTASKTRTNLINDPIGGCASVDNTPYSTLLDYTGTGVPVNDNVTLTTYTGTASVSSAIKASGLRSFQLSMNAIASAANRHFVAYGPRLISNEFPAFRNQVLTFEFFGLASNAYSISSDMMLIQSYLIDTSDCSVTSTSANGALRDSSGGNGHFTQGSVTIPRNGTYKLIIVLGAFDQNGDSKAITTVFIDNVTYGLEQTITWNGAFTNPYIGQTYTLTNMASGFPGMKLSFRALPTSVCSMVNSFTLRLIAAGQCHVLAAQAGDTTYAAVTRLYSSKPINVINSTMTSTRTNTRTPTATRTATRTTTRTNTQTSTNTATNTLTPSNTSTITLTSTKTFTASRTPTNTPTFTKTNTSTKTSTNTSTRTFTKTATSTPTMTSTRTNTSTRTMVPVALKKAAIGNLFVLGLLHNDTLVTWGKNDFLQAQFIAVTPVSLPIDKQFIDVAAAIQSSYAVDIDGNLYLWGDNSQGELNAPVNARTFVTGVGAGGRFAFVIKDDPSDPTDDGTVIGWGENGNGQITIPIGLSNVVQIDGGDRHSVALKNDGTVAAWGYTSGPLIDCLGQDSPVNVPVEYTDGSSPVIEVSAGQDHTLVLRANGTVDGWGCNDRGQINIPASATNVVSIAAGRKVSLAARADGSVVAWGLAEYRDFSAAGFGVPPVTVQVFPATLDAVQVDSQNQNSIIGQRNGRIIVGGRLFNGVNISRTPTKTATPSPTP